MLPYPYTEFDDWGTENWEEKYERNEYQYLKVTFEDGYVVSGRFIAKWMIDPGEYDDASISVNRTDKTLHIESTSNASWKTENFTISL